MITYSKLQSKEPLAKSANNVTLSKAKGLGWWANQIRSDAPPQILHSVQNDFCKRLKIAE